LKKLEELLRRSEKCFTRAVSRLYPELVVLEGDGIYVKGADGNTYLDFLTTSCALGHRHPKIMKAVTQQLNKLDHFYGELGLHEPFLELAEKLKETAPKNLKDGKVAYACSGTEAAEFSVKLARCVSKKPVIISYHWAHHGYGSGVISFTSDMVQTKLDYAPAISNVVYVPYPYCYRCVFGQEYPECDLLCLEYIRHVLDVVVPPESVAGILLEPIQGWNGFIIPPNNYIPKLSRLCATYGLLLIDDEVLMGMGRTGKMFGIEHWDVDPDIMVLGKALGFGFPLAAIIARKDLIDSWKTGGQGGSLSSPAGNPIACAAALQGIKVIQSEKLIDAAAKRGEYLMKRLNEIASMRELIGDVRGKGLLAGIEVVKNLRTKEPAPEEAQKAVQKSFKNGVLFDWVGSYRQIIRLIPPLTVTTEQIDKAMEALDKAIKDAEHNR